MGKPNNVILDYLDAAERFADLFNSCCFQGRQVIKPDELEEASERYTEETLSHGHGQKGRRNGQPRSRTRDIKKRMKNGCILRILGLEAQSHIDYTMPVRGMNYDTQEYLKQLREIQRRNQKAADGCATPDEYLCGVLKTDRLAPVYTICLYHGTAEWDGPLSLKDMMNFDGEDDVFRVFFKDYPLYLVRADKPMDYSVFRTPLRELLKVLALRQDRDSLFRLIEEDPAYQKLDRETAEAIAVLTNTEDLIHYMEREDKEEYDMCKAMKELLEDATAKGIAQGIDQGITQGIDQGIAQGIQEGIEIGIYQNLCRLIQKGMLPLHTAAMSQDMTEEEFIGKLNELHLSV